MEHYEVKVETNPCDADIDTIVHNLELFNDLQARHEPWRRLAIFVRDDENKIVGGLTGYTHWDWLFISHVWVSAHLRGQGYGRRLIQSAEEEAIQRGCLHAHVDTYSFQARGFYEALGYRIFGVLEDFPQGHTRYFFQRRNITQIQDAHKSHKLYPLQTMAESF